MMKSWKDSFVGSTLRVGFESSISGDKLKDLINRACQADNDYMHVTIAADHAFFTATLQTNPKGMITLDGTDVAFIGIVKDECQYPVMLVHGKLPHMGCCVCVNL